MEEEEDYEYCLEVIDYNLIDDNISLIRTDYELEVISDKNSEKKECKFLDIYETEGKKETKVDESSISETQFSCKECSFKAKDKASLRQHTEVHRKPFSCPQCSYRSKLKSSLTIHVNAAHPNTLGKVNSIRIRTKSQINQLKDTDITNESNAASVKAVEGIKQRKTTNDGGEIKQESTNEDNLSKEEEDSEKSIDGVVVKTKSGQPHLIRVTKGTPRVSKFKKNTKKGGKITKKIVEAETLYGCDSCDFTTPSSYSLKRHLETHDKDEVAFTNKLYSIKPVLNDDEDLVSFSFDNYLFKTTYNCTECEFFNSDKSRFNLHWFKNHLKVFDGGNEVGGWDVEKYFDSLELGKSGKISKTSEGLKDGYNVYCCNLCDYFSRDTAKFVLHLTRHVEERIHSCKFCDGRFSKEESLKDHVRLCHEPDVIYCPVCDMWMEDRTALKKHIGSHKCEKEQESMEVIA